MTRSSLVVALAVGLAACSPAKPPPPATPALPPQPATPPWRAVEALRNLVFDSKANYAFAMVDLNGDGSEEVVAYVMSPDFCGSGGCPLFVLTTYGRRYAVVGQTTVTQTPIRLLPSSTNGWRDLSVAVGGGGAPVRQVKMVFDGRFYPRNPTTVDAPVDSTLGVELIAAGATGQPLPAGPPY